MPTEEKYAVVEYLDGFQKLMGRMEATDLRGRPMPIDAGLRHGIDLIRNLKLDNRKLFFVGNGGSAAIASHLAVDYWKTGQMRAIVLNDPSFLTCISNDYGYSHVFEKPLETFCDHGDGLIAISSSGKSENILRAASTAKARGLKVITLSGFAADNPLRSLGEVNFYVPSTVYNYVETLHMLLCTCVLDCIVLPQATFLT